MMERKLFAPVTAFDNYEIVSHGYGELVIRTVVNEGSLNPYGNAHGGFLYTLCDTVAGGTAATLRAYTVTLQSNINYLKPASYQDVLTVKGSTIHNGRSTKIIHVDIYNQNDVLLCTSTFTMFTAGEIDDDTWEKEMEGQL